MVGLLFIGFLAGVIAGVSPCILPVLPVVLVDWGTPIEDTEHPFRARRQRSVAVVTGLVLSFSIVTAVGSVLLSSLGLPENLLRTLGIVMLVLFGLGLLVPRLEVLLERPFARLTVTSPRGTGPGFLLGLGLGAVFAPCAGPVLAAISVLGATHRASLYSVVLSLFFATGAACPLLVIALAGDRLIERNRRLAQRARRLRPYAGLLLILMAIAISLNATSVVQRWIPGYTQTLQRHVEGNSFAFRELRSLSGTSTNDGSLSACESAAAFAPSTSLQRCGLTPQLRGITRWLNTPGDRPLTLSSLKGHVVLIDFWTYSCINCQRALPHVEAWYARYHADGLDVIGVQSPEFAFEHVIGNVRDAARSLGVAYPIAVDNNLATWTAFQNQYWPAEYLIDAQGVIRHVDYGEGDYPQSEALIRQLLKAANPKATLPPPTSVPDRTPTEQISPETYLGYERSEYLSSPQGSSPGTTSYTFPSSIPSASYALAGTWLTTNQSITAVSHATLGLNFQAAHVYLVLGGKGTIRETLNGGAARTIRVGGFPRLYTLVTQSGDTKGLLLLHCTPGVVAYDFTFG